MEENDAYEVSSSKDSEGKTILEVKCKKCEGITTFEMTPKFGTYCVKCGEKFEDLLPSPPLFDPARGPML